MTDSNGFELKWKAKYELLFEIEWILIISLNIFRPKREQETKNNMEN